jgi:hypothetical protein
MNLERSDLEKILKEVVIPEGNIDLSLPGAKWNGDLYSPEQIRFCKLITKCVEIAQKESNESMEI